MIAGDGPQKNNIQKQVEYLKINSNVRLIGHTDNVPQFLMAIDILVLSSDSKEGVPQSVMQGLFMNKSVVATNCGSTADLLYENNFQLIEKGSVSSIVDGTSHYLDNNIRVSSRDYMMKYFMSHSFRGLNHTDPHLTLIENIEISRVNTNCGAPDRQPFDFDRKH